MKKQSIIYLVVSIVVVALFVKIYFFPQLAKPLKWDNNNSVKELTHVLSDSEMTEMQELRKRFERENRLPESNSDFDTLKRIVRWTHRLWKHDGTQTPSHSDPLIILNEVSEGKNFRCTEFAIIVASTARSLGLPSRVLSLKRADVETAESNAGHVVAEVWLRDLKKWVMADAQFDVIPEFRGIPLNAVEFQSHLSDFLLGLKLNTSSVNTFLTYRDWVDSYLYYFEVLVDQRFFVKEKDNLEGSFMLVPSGAREPKVYQRTTPIDNCIYIRDPGAFYKPPHVL